MLKQFYFEQFRYTVLISKTFLFQAIHFSKNSDGSISNSSISTQIECQKSSISNSSISTQIECQKSSNSNNSV